MMDAQLLLRQTGQVPSTYKCELYIHDEHPTGPATRHTVACTLLCVLHASPTAASEQLWSRKIDAHISTNPRFQSKVKE